MHDKKTQEPEPSPKPRLGAPDWDPVDEASWESFPASDAPAISAEAVEFIREHGPTNNFDDAERRALHDALDWAYRAAAGIEQLLLSLGDSPPLIELQRSQARQIATLQHEFAVHGLMIPDDAWAHASARGVTGPETVDAVVEAAIRAQEGACEAYEALIRTSERDAGLAVYRELLRVAKDEHLPALRQATGVYQAQG